MAPALHVRLAQGSVDPAGAYVPYEQIVHGVVVFKSLSVEPAGHSSELQLPNEPTGR